VEGFRLCRKFLGAKLFRSEALCEGSVPLERAQTAKMIATFAELYAHMREAVEGVTNHTGAGGRRKPG
jgi:hypothetical protein